MRTISSLVDLSLAGKSKISFLKSVVVPLIIPVLVGTIFIFSTILAVIFFSSSVFIWDQWEDIAYVQKFISHNLNITDLFNQHNEHRIFFPRIIFFLDYFISNSNEDVNLAFNLILQSMTLLFIASMCARIVGGIRRVIYPLAFSAILMFSLGQWENFIWGFQVQFLGVFTASAAAFWSFSAACQAGQDKKSGSFLLIFAFVLAGVATYSLSNGILAPLLLIALALQQRASRNVVIATFSWLVLLAFSYFHNFHPIAGHAPYAYSLEHPVEYVGYVAAYLGNIASFLGPHVGMPQIAVAKVVGFVGLALTVTALAQTLFSKGNAPMRSALLAVILFVTGTALLTSLGRITFGTEQALSSRYQTPVSIFWAAQLFYWWAVEQAKPRAWQLAWRAGWWGMAILLSISAIIGHCNGWDIIKARRLVYNKIEDAFLSNVWDKATYETTYPDRNRMEVVIAFLREHHLNIFSNNRSQLLGRKLVYFYDITDDGTCLGFIDRLSVATTDSGIEELTAGGWAWNLRSHKAINHLVFVDQEKTVIGFASGGWGRPDVKQAIADIPQPNVGWEGYLRAAPQQAVSIYGLLPDHKACRVANHLTP